mmetsp:Transcript_618/g.711  ORF Transcript_618/g.711 Transcript_618/m.711 type:complete len:172 (+) Transcript_618:880-1395(+)|eukprot:CAMPEP_0205804644 /NCGR_PEP_ID=MMETSP0205-20121125/7629_1 /ASSEMBLY_ACC=CAM_ASM_000278 /TAXON_ID=36767 /ORGANISM="Euplotes focardii, Strain TN1" /LENGTH=171 /DNA_ID=CAMNT_0053074591 /DNA_START=889 /DNA_END=1401 /DNA_ORIENTATION=+
MYFEAPKKDEENKEEVKLTPISEEESPEEYYKKYVKYINQCLENEDDNFSDAKSIPVKMTKEKSYDRDDYSYDIKDSISSTSKDSKTTGGYNFDDLDFDKFSTFMSKKYGEERFKKGYEVVQKFKSERFEKKLELEDTLKGILSNETEVEDFVGLCSSYMLLENYATSMSG